MGVGKSTTGRPLAEALDWPYVDSDGDIEMLTGRSGRDIAKELNVSALHQLEAALLLGALARTEPHVITAAASVVENPMVQDVLPRNALVVRLVAPVEVTLIRKATGEHRRPMSAEALRELEARRDPLFEALEDVKLDAGRDTEVLVREIIEQCRAREM